MLFIRIIFEFKLAKWCYFVESVVFYLFFGAKQLKNNFVQLTKAEPKPGEKMIFDVVVASKWIKIYLPGK